MILETTDDDYPALLAGREPRGLKLPDTVLDEEDGPLICWRCVVR
jgi:hypothetical protein